MEQTLFRIVQEGLSQHCRGIAGATRAGVAVLYQEREIEIRIGDNGTGFEPGQTNDGLGLRLIHERLEGIGGQVLIQSRRGNGTLLTMHVPAPPHDQE